MHVQGLCSRRPNAVLPSLEVDHGFGVAGGEGVHVGEDEVLGAVTAKGGLVLALDDGEGAEDVGGVVAVDAVEVEVAGVEAGAEVAAVFFIPDEGRAGVAEVAGERGQVVGGVGELEDVVADEGAGGGLAELAVVGVGGDDGELLDDEPSSNRCSLNLLASNKVERKAVQVCGPLDKQCGNAVEFIWSKNLQAEEKLSGRTVFQHPRWDHRQS